jgi:hypothetical protein
MGQHIPTFLQHREIVFYQVFRLFTSILGLPGREMRKMPFLKHFFEPNFANFHSLDVLLSGKL